LLILYGKVPRMHTRKKGTEIEHLVSQYLEGQNYKILQQNFTIHGGEIDIIARDPIVSTLVFIEVKYRTSNRFGEGVEQLTGYKRRHIKRASLHFLSAYLQKDNICKKIRYDFIVVTPSKIPGKKFKIQHFKNVQMG